ncbi:hypothetical protein C8F04DRAFT_1069160 [Mycena alexandri]|uniref:Uncharacterized protein n=1 Tax=Mycena alexandri TaxID=1745969 RepID=A0AAD6XDU1_9AGAR|nr:hypothetical protein C8F04DRAFT_1069160 [Mycena alexandri]
MMRCGRACLVGAGPRTKTESRCRAGVGANVERREADERDGRAGKLSTIRPGKTCPSHQRRPDSKLPTCRNVEMSSHYLIFALWWCEDGVEAAPTSCSQQIGQVYPAGIAGRWGTGLFVRLSFPASFVSHGRRRTTSRGRGKRWTRSGEEERGEGGGETTERYDSGATGSPGWETAVLARAGAASIRRMEADSSCGQPTPIVEHAIKLTWSVSSTEDGVERKWGGGSRRMSEGDELEAVGQLQPIRQRGEGCIGGGRPRS